MGLHLDLADRVGGLEHAGRLRRPRLELRGPDPRRDLHEAPHQGDPDREIASLCVEHGVDGIIVTNHGGRVVDSGLSTIEVLPEIARSVGGRFPIPIDSGFRRGSDFFKALALGASAVCVGRPYLWGLAAFGQEGVEAVLDMLRRELEAMLRQMGTPPSAAITPAHVQARERD